MSALSTSTIDFSTVLGVSREPWYVPAAFIGTPVVLALMIATFIGPVFFVIPLLALSYVSAAFLIGEAADRKGRHRAAWTFIALGLGLVIPAVLIACMADSNVPTRGLQSGDKYSFPTVESVSCPFCAEDVKAAAIKCKHCGSELPGVNAEQSRTRPQLR